MVAHLQYVPLSSLATSSFRDAYLKVSFTFYRCFRMTDGVRRIVSGFVYSLLPFLVPRLKSN